MSLPAIQTNLPDDYDGCANRIKKLPPLLVNQLAAGEVVLRPASVVKELIENAIDAGASTIDIRITQGGMGIIEVCDNGCGIHPDDMVMAVTRFATSKVADVAHLQGIATLGFRGEALAATAAVSRLTLKSSSDDSGIGRELTVAGILEDTPSLTPIVHPKGTTVTVRDLYFNVPARRGNLKSISIEFAHIEAVVKQLALIASDVEISLWHNDKRRFHFPAVNTHANTSIQQPFLANQTESTTSIMARLQMLSPSFGQQPQAELANTIQTINIDLDGLVDGLKADEHYFITGFLVPTVSHDHAVASSPANSHKLIYINGRLVKDRYIAQSLRECAASLQTIQQDMVISDLGYVLFFNLPKVWLNVNVHPSKQHIKIQNLANISAHLKVGVRSSLQSWLKKQHLSTLLPQTDLTTQNSDSASSNLSSSNSGTDIAVKPVAAHPQNASDGGHYNRKVYDPDSNVANTAYLSNSLVHENPVQYEFTASQAVNTLQDLDGSNEYASDQKLTDKYATPVLRYLFTLPIQNIEDLNEASSLITHLPHDVLSNAYVVDESIVNSPLVLIQAKDHVFIFVQTLLLDCLLDIVKTHVLKAADDLQDQYAIHANANADVVINQLIQTINQYEASQSEARLNQSQWMHLLTQNALTQMSLKAVMLIILSTQPG